MCGNESVCLLVSCFNLFPTFQRYLEYSDGFAMYDGHLPDGVGIYLSQVLRPGSTNTALRHSHLSDAQSGSGIALCEKTLVENHLLCLDAAAAASFLTLDTSNEITMTEPYNSATRFVVHAQSAQW